MQQILNVQDVLSIFIFDKNDVLDMQYAVVAESIIKCLYPVWVYRNIASLYLEEKKHIQWPFKEA